MMRNFIAILVGLLAATGVFAQDRYFLSIQSADQQPFYVRIANTTYSSSAIGHVVVPSLGDSTYQLMIGFPRNKYPEQQYMVAFNRKDIGYTLKQTDGQDWKLVDWESGSSISPREGQGTGGTAVWYGEKKKESAFTNMMAAVVNDSAVLYVASVKNIPGKQEVFAQANTASPAAAEPVQTGVTAVAFTDSNLLKTVSEPATVQIKLTEKPGDSTLVTTIQGKDSVVAKVADVVDSAVIVQKNTEAGLAKTDSAVAILITKPDTTATTTAVQVDSTAASVAAKPAEPVKESTQTPILVYSAPRPSIYKIQDFDYNKARNMKYVDSTGAAKDTISVIIDFEPDEPKAAPAEKKVAAEPASKAPDTAKTVAVTQPAVNNSTTAPVAPTAGNSNTAAGTTAANSNPVQPTTAEAAKPAPANTAAPEGEKKKLVLINSDCANFATDNDIDKLRVKLIDMSDIDARLTATRKLLKSKCIYTRQIRALSELFTSDEGRYKFFETCYPLTADTSEFRQLLGLLSEDAYIARFKTLVRMKD